MDPLQKDKDAVRCDSCGGPDYPLHCDICQLKLCKKCVGDHLLDSSVRHQIIPFEERDSVLTFSKCQAHSPRQCELYCEQCEIFICIHCVTSSDHQNHRIVDAKNIYESKRTGLRRDLLDFENSILAKYQEIANDIKLEKFEFCRHFNKLEVALSQLSREWHREIDILFSKLKIELDHLGHKLSLVLSTQQNEITNAFAEINQSIVDLKEILESNDVLRVSVFKSNIAKFRKMPPKLRSCLPVFSPPIINFKKIYEESHAFSDSYITKEDRGYIAETLKDEAVLSKSFLEEPRIISTIETEYGGFFHGLHNVSFCNENEILTSGKDNILRLYNIQGELLESIKTKSGNEPWDIATTRSGDLVYTDPNDRSVNIVKNKQVENVIILLSWRPRSVCCTSTDDLLIIMDSDVFKQTRVVRYRGFKEKQSIQFYNKTRPLFSFGDNIKYICENGNRNICVADSGADAIVVVNQVGKLRFTYKGPNSSLRGSFHPRGLATDSQNRIVTTDSFEHRIHILDQDGQFLRYIDNCDLDTPWGICIDTRDNLFIADNPTGKVTIVQYYS